VVAGRLGIGILGCGTIGPLHAEAIAELDSARLVAVADLQPERAAALAGRYGAQACSSLGALLCVPGVDLVSVCTPSGTHGELGVEVAAAGRHVVLEKPIDVSLAAADEVIAACARSGVVLSVISQHRFDAGVVALRRALLDGAFGRVVLADARAFWYRTQAYYDADGWRGTLALDGGALMNQGIHLFDLLLHLLGPLESAFARSGTVAHSMEAEDVLVAALSLAGGTLASLAVTTASYPGMPETLAVTGTKGSVWLEAGAVASWQLSTPAPELGGAASAALGSRHLAATAHRAQLADVVSAVRVGAAPAVTGADGRAALAGVLACYESARSGVDVHPL